MFNAVKTFLKLSSTRTGILAAIMFQLIFSIVWMTGYSGVSNNINNLKIAVVNEDQGVGANIIGELTGKIPFHVNVVDNKELAEQQLQKREVHMIITIPSGFSQQLQSLDGKTKIEYTINESNPSLIKSIMQETSVKITTQFNQVVTANTTQTFLAMANLPDELANTISQLIKTKVASETIYTNKVKNTANQMIPLMIVLASYVGAMLMAMNMQQSSMTIGSSMSKWEKLRARGLINFVFAFVISFVGSSFILLFGGETQEGFISIWLFQSLLMMTFMFMTQLFVLIFGIPGMVFNILGLSVQLVTSGALIPRELLSNFYFELSEYFPATYAVRGLMNILFGGTGTGDEIMALAIILAITFVLGTVAVWLKKDVPSIKNTQQLQGELAK